MKLTERHDSMSWLSEFLKRVHIISPFTRDDELNAEAENALHDQRRALQDAKTEFQILHDKGTVLRDVMQEARLRVTSFAQFEQRIKDMTTRRKDN